MMDAMHLRCDEDFSHDPLKGSGDPHVRVGEEGKGVQEDLERQGRPWADAEDQDDAGLVKGGRNDLEKMKAKPRRGVEIQVSVMNSMKGPEKRNPMKEKMLKPDGEIKDDDSDSEV
jgi:hypothetical protein